MTQRPKKNKKGHMLDGVTDDTPTPRLLNLSEDNCEPSDTERQSKPDATLYFMTSCVTLTAYNEMPIVAPYTGPIPTDIIGLYRTTSKTSPNTAPHFFFPDERIRAYWNHPFRTEKLLSRFGVSISMDFSMTSEMSRPQKIFSSFQNKLWAALLYSRGHNILPNISFPDEYWENYWIEGWPKHSIIAVSSNSIIQHGDPEIWLGGMSRIREELKPIHILRYGPLIEGEDTSICTFFSNDNGRAANGC